MLYSRVSSMFFFFLSMEMLTYIQKIKQYEASLLNCTKWLRLGLKYEDIKFYIQVVWIDSL